MESTWLMAVLVVESFIEDICPGQESIREHSHAIHTFWHSIAFGTEVKTINQCFLVLPEKRQQGQELQRSTSAYFPMVKKSMYYNNCTSLIPFLIYLHSLSNNEFASIELAQCQNYYVTLIYRICQL